MKKTDLEQLIETIVRKKLNESQLQLHQLVSVSNNSRITNMLLNVLNDKLDDEEKRLFIEWLSIIKRGN